MPEGDILLKVARRLHTALAGETLTRGELRSGRAAGADLRGMTVTSAVSYGKNTLIRLDSGLTLHTHLLMDGTWTIDEAEDPPRAMGDPRIRVVLSTRRWAAIGRLIGRVNLLATTEEDRLLQGLGPDLLAGHDGARDCAPPDFEAIAAAAGGLAASIGEVLLNQRIAAGIGTIYLAESLWIARVNPLAPAQELPPEHVERIYRTASALMARSADAPTPTATGDLRPGWRTHVHGRDRRPCRRCGQPLGRTMVGIPPTQRPAFFCPVCQPPP